jgi:hypothetical protein
VAIHGRIAAIGAREDGISLEWGSLDPPQRMVGQRDTWAY